MKILKYKKMSMNRIMKIKKIKNLNINIVISIIKIILITFQPGNKNFNRKKQIIHSIIKEIL